MILTREPDSHHRRLLDILAENGGDNALRLLVSGLTFDDTPCDRLLLETLGRFGQPLAVGVLGEVVHRSNTQTPEPALARTALAALRRMGTPEARAFLAEVVHGRFAWFYRFRRDLRDLAREEVSA